jgi:hypothetical protein
MRVSIVSALDGIPPDARRTGHEQDAVEFDGGKFSSRNGGHTAALARKAGITTWGIRMPNELMRYLSEVAEVLGEPWCARTLQCAAKTPRFSAPREATSESASAQRRAGSAWAGSMAD